MTAWSWQSLVSGGMTILNVRWLITVHVIQRRLRYRCIHGRVEVSYGIPSQVSVVSSIVSPLWMASKNGRRNTEDYEFGTNPCSEIILRNREFCNLSEVVVRASDTRESLLEKVRLATILGTFQSTLVNFKYVSKSWRKEL